MNKISHGSHWGAFNAIVENGRLVGVEPTERDANPSPILRGMPDALYHGSRVTRPAIRKSWLAKGFKAGGKDRGAEPFVEVPWDEALDIVASELKRVKAAIRQRGDFRRLLWLVQRRPLPPRQDPAPAFHGRLRRFYQSEAQLLARRRSRDPAAHPRRPSDAQEPIIVGGYRAEHETVPGVRRLRHKERSGRARWLRRAYRGAVDAATGRRRRGIHLHHASARRHAGAART